ncbi:hypothetical protein BJ912DRAFT_927287 [Pholiota molesta]|nr:hypothetical protein BJ912DRAFT_927287 [Pholiota molesta]
MWAPALGNADGRKGEGTQGDLRAGDPAVSARGDEGRGHRPRPLFFMLLHGHSHRTPRLPRCSPPGLCALPGRREEAACTHPATPVPPLASHPLPSPYPAVSRAHRTPVRAHASEARPASDGPRTYNGRVRRLMAGLAVAASPHAVGMGRQACALLRALPAVADWNSCDWWEARSRDQASLSGRWVAQVNASAPKELFFSKRVPKRKEDSPYAARSSGPLPAICIHRPRWPLGTPASTRREPPRTRTAASCQTVRATSPLTDDERKRADHPTQQLTEHPRQRNATRPGAQLRTTRHRLCERASERRRRGKAVEGKDGEGGPRRARTAPTRAAVGHRGAMLDMAPQVRAPPLPSNRANPPPQRHFTVRPAVPAVHAGPASGCSCGARRPSPMPPSTAPQVHWPANHVSTPPQRYVIVRAAYALSGGKGPPRRHRARRPSPM